MKFIYEYRTSDNVQHTGHISASNREAAFQSLRAQGIRPARLVEAPGIFNKLFGKGKRWLVIAVLGVASVFLFVDRQTAIRADRTAPRAQIYGDPELLQQCALEAWSNVFSLPGELLFANFAQPGVLSDTAIVGERILTDALDHELDFPADEPGEFAKMKRIVNGMKAEFAAYLDAGGTEAGYKKRLMERQNVEAGIFRTTKGELDRLAARLGASNRVEIAEVWEKKNAMLRSFGLRTIPMPEEEP